MYKSTYYLILITNLLFVCLLTILCFNNRFAIDDYYFIYLTNKFGSWDGMIEMYNSMSGRWASYLLLFNALKYQHLTYSLFLFCLCVHFLLITSIYFFLKLSANELKESMPSKWLLILSVSFYLHFFFSSFSIAETFFWFQSMGIYLLSIFFQLAVIYLIFKKSWSSANVLALILACLFIGGASESFAMNFIVLLILFLEKNILKLKKLGTEKILENKEVKKIVFSILLISISFAIVVFAPGTKNRYHLLPHYSLLETSWIYIKSIIKIFFVKIPQQLPFLLVFAIPFFVFGILNGNGNTNYKNIARKIFLNFVKTSVLICIFLIPTSFIMSEIGPNRSLAQISFVLSIFFCWAFYFLGKNVLLTNTLKYLCLSVLTAAAIFTFFSANQQYSITTRYAKKLDERINYLLLGKDTRQKVVFVDPLPYSGMLYSAEISKDSSHFSNIHLKLGLNLRSSIVRKD